MAITNKEKIFDVVVCRETVVKVIANNQKEARAIAEDVIPTEEFAQARNISKKTGSGMACSQETIDEQRRNGKNIYTRTFQSKVATIRSILIASGFNMQNLVVAKACSEEAFIVRIFEPVEFNRLQQALDKIGGSAIITEGMDVHFRKKRFLRITIKFN